MERIILENKNSKLELDLKNGAQILKLFLESKKGNIIEVIKPFDVSKNFFLSGNFFMFPWVNRVEKDFFELEEKKINFISKAKTDNQFLIHGSYFDQSRKVIFLQKNIISIKPTSYIENFPEFEETYKIEQNQLEIITTFRNKENFIMQFAFGYHPYLKLNKKIDELNFKTNLKKFIPLDENLVPNKNLLTENIEKIFIHNNFLSKINLDHLFVSDSNEEENFFSIIDSENDIELKLFYDKNSLYKYFQIYTPEDRESIAIEPMSSTGNSFFIKNSNLIHLKPNEEVSTSFKISLT